ncbi:MAG: sialate O-acetylesterase [Ruminococcaceae bacterium]|nr:sialate O-acetylesterase [Oscillospiraceae bacterium]
MLLKDFSKEKYDIIIQAGQSNSDGTAFGNVENEYQPNDRVWYLTGDWRFSEDFYFEIAREYAQNNTVRGNFSLSFAKRYINDGRLAADRKLLILRTAAGGTGFLDGHWKTTDWLYNRMMLMLQTSMELNPENRLIALLWHQGETDAVYHASYDVHYKHLTEFIQSVRKAFQIPELPFVAGNFTEQWYDQNKEIADPVVTAIRNVCKDIGNASFVESIGLLSNAQDDENNPFHGNDTIHFCRKAMYELGERYYDAFVHIVGE